MPARQLMRLLVLILALSCLPASAQECTEGCGDPVSQEEISDRSKECDEETGNCNTRPDCPEKGEEGHYDTDQEGPYNIDTVLADLKEFAPAVYNALSGNPPVIKVMTSATRYPITVTYAADQKTMVSYRIETGRTPRM